MTQGAQTKVKKAAMTRKQVQKASAQKKVVKKGAPLQLPKGGTFRDAAMDDRYI
jgi:hypothetical protein